MNATVNVALVGICGYGASYLSALLDGRQDDGFRLVGIVDPGAVRSPRLPEVLRCGIPVHSELPRLFASDHVDLTLMSTPIHLHAPHTCAALAEGSNVLCEKPLGATVDDAVQVERAEHRAAGLFVAVGYQWSFSRAVQALKRDVMSGSLGAPRRLKTIAMFPRGENYYARNSWAGRIATASGEHVFDSPLNNATAHYLHNMLYLLGGERESSATPAWVEAELYRANDIESYDTAALRCRTACGTEVLFYTTHGVPERVGPVCRFEFERGVVEYDHGRGAEFVARFDDGRVVSYGQPDLDRHDKIWQCIDAVRTGEPVACGPRAAMPHTHSVLAAPW
jgi:predicted dehydrogenase